MRQQCPEVERETVDVEMCDGPMGTSLRRSSRKAAREVTDTIRYLAEEWVHNKSSRQDGANKRPAVGSPKWWNQVRRIPYMFQYQNAKVLEPMTLLRVWNLEKKLLLPLPMTPHV